MDKYDYQAFDVHRAGLQEDLRRGTSNELSAARADAMNQMIKLILDHKKEITKVPQASTIRGAQEWAAKRPGFRATLEDIGGDSEKEVVVFDKAGRPFMVNGYKLKASDYGVRKAYWSANPTAEDRAGNPMREWAQDYVWKSEEDPHNMWNSSVTKNEKAYNELKEWGYRMPTKPKKEMSPYSIFSKLIAPIVKTVITSQEMIAKINAKPPVMGLSAAGPANCEFIRKLISPISFYRYLYMRLVEQKFFFALLATESTKHFASSYSMYKKYVKDNKQTFRKWFMDHVLDGGRKEKFKDAWVSAQVVLDNLVKNDIDWDGRDIQDGIVHLIGIANLKISITSDNTKTVAHLICDNATAAEFLATLADKKNPNYKICKKIMEKIKKISQQSIDAYFKRDDVKKAIFENEKAYSSFIQGAKVGVPNATDAQSANAQQRVATAPASPPVVKQVKEMRVLSDDEPDDEDGVPSAYQEEIDRAKIDRWYREAQEQGIDPNEYIKAMTGQ